MTPSQRLASVEAAQLMQSLRDQMDTTQLNSQSKLPEQSSWQRLTFITVPEQSDWKCYLFGCGDGLVYHPAKGREPNWFWRKMQYLILGHKWVKLPAKK